MCNARSTPATYLDIEDILRGGASMCCCGQNIPIIGRLISVIYLAIATPDS